MDWNAKHSINAATPPSGAPVNARRGRREFVKGLTAVAGCRALLGGYPSLAAADPPPDDEAYTHQ